MIATQVKTVSGTGKTTQSVHYLLNEYEDLSLTLHKPYEIAKHFAYFGNISAEEAEAGGFLGLAG